MAQIGIADKATLGAAGDAPAAAGSIMARLAELLVNRLTAARAAKIDSIINWAVKTPGIASYTVVSQGSYETALNISGAGYLLGLSEYNLYGIIKVTIDGSIIFNNALGSQSASSTVTLSLNCMFRFNTSLNIQVQNPSGQGFSTLGMSYVLD